MKGWMVILAVMFYAGAYAGEHYSFDWKQGQKDLGDLEIAVEKTEGGIAVTYASTLSVNVGMQMDIEEHWSSQYDAGRMLADVQVQRKINGTSKISISEKADEAGSFLRTVNGQAKPAERGDTEFSYLLLFTTPPEGVDRLYSELYGTIFTVRKVGDDSYVLTDTKNRKHKFTYDESGRLVKADVELSMGRFDLVLRTEGSR